MRHNIAADVLFDRSLQLVTQNKTEGVISTRSRAVLMSEGGYVANPDMVLSHGNKRRFPTGLYVVQIVVTDHQGLSGDILVGTSSEIAIKETLM